MNKSEKQTENYQKKLDILLTNVSKLTTKPRLLLHACCGPCSSYVLEYLYQFFDITVLYYNPNIYPEEEYRRRYEELRLLYTKFPPALEGKVEVVELPYDPEEFYETAGTRVNPELATEPEKGERCRRCYELRLRRAWDFAASHNFDYFCTTLSISPFKDAEKINQIGAALEKENEKGPRWLPSDFKKKGGFKRSLEISEEYGMYRQDYCGCIYSKQSTQRQAKSDIIES